MSVRANRLWDHGKPTVFLMRQWTQKGALQPIRPLNYLASDGTALPELRRVWSAAFPTRGPLPQAPLSDRAGLGTDEFWNVFA